MEFESLICFVAFSFLLKIQIAHFSLQRKIQYLYTLKNLKPSIITRFSQRKRVKRVQNNMQYVTGSQICQIATCLSQFSFYFELKQRPELFKKYFLGHNTLFVSQNKSIIVAVVVVVVIRGNFNMRTNMLLVCMQMQNSISN